MHGRARRQVLGDRPPLAAGGQHIHQAIDHGANIHLAPPAAALAGRDQRPNQRLLLIGHVARIAQLASIVALAVLVRPQRRPPNNQAAALESQMIPMIQYCSGQTVTIQTSSLTTLK